MNAVEVRDELRRLGFEVASVEALADGRFACLVLEQEEAYALYEAFPSTELDRNVESNTYTVTGFEA